jgi:F-type H+-transporting ATPase subunit epsilon
MRLKLMLPTEVAIDREVDRIVAESARGSFCLLPRHQDFVAALVPGLLSFVSGGKEEFMAVDEGVLVKTGAQVLISTRRAVRGPDLGSLQQMVAEEFLELDQKQQSSRAAMAKLEANFARKLYELGKKEP